MLFTSPLFLFGFLPLLFLLLTAPFVLDIALKKPLNQNRQVITYQNSIILLASCLFYLWGEPRFILIALASSYIDLVLSRLIHHSTNIRMKKTWLTLSIVLNLGLLFYFKYASFAVENLNILLLNWIGAPTIHIGPILLPLAISFIVFEKITYVVDVYRGVGKPAQTPWQYFTYIMLFPKLIAGPIIKYHDIQDQLTVRTITAEGVELGFARFVQGLAKKVFIADTMAEVVDTIFKYSPEQLGFWDAWLGVFCFAMQIYFDFSGYSDMAIGLLKTMGFTISENFNMPYIAQSFTDFWRRWHISLSTFIRDYIYFPLGGNRCSKPRQYFNLMTCFLISGLWHGASWTFVLWGAYHGAFLTLDKVMQDVRIGSLAKHPLVASISTFILVLIGWTIFRAESMSQLGWFLTTMLNPTKAFCTYVPDLTNNILFFMMLGLVLSVMPPAWVMAHAHPWLKQRWVTFGLMTLLFVCCLGKIAIASFKSFIYFRF